MASENVNFYNLPNLPKISSESKTPPPCRRALKKSPLTKMCYRNVNKKTHICCKRNVLYAI